MTSILALDAAWTIRQPSGVALLSDSTGQWRCVALAPSYERFQARAHDQLVDWAGEITASTANVASLLDASRAMAGEDVDVVTIDMPVSRVNITGRRPADDAVSRHFGAAGCSTHSPSALRPGVLGQNLTEAFERRGYPLATTSSRGPGTRALYEVYPHPALLLLLDEQYRIPYKVAKSSTYWPGVALAQRHERIVALWHQILGALGSSIIGIDLVLPSVAAAGALTSAYLKRYEDALDALIGGWIGIQLLEGRGTPYGDELAAIWIPERPFPPVA